MLGQADEAFSSPAGAYEYNDQEKKETLPAKPYVHIDGIGTAPAWTKLSTTSASLEQEDRKRRTHEHHSPLALPVSIQ